MGRGGTRALRDTFLGSTAERASAAGSSRSWRSGWPLARRTATRQIAKLLAASLAQAKVRPAEAPPWKTHVRCGSPRLVIEKAVKKADSDLLVLGTHGDSGVAHVFLGTVAGDVLREVANTSSAATAASTQRGSWFIRSPPRAG
ncbi:universal stress protein [Sorangium sp. So ce233]|uniref:universal stress protein n=1 Tax=Sorangium sp. So ce233 TaxID=3133290 RepID=UPI003F647244